MTGIKATKSALDAASASFNHGVFDESGAGSGPFDSHVVFIDPATNAVLTPAKDASVLAGNTTLTSILNNAQTRVNVTATVTASSAYTTGNVVGGLLHFAAVMNTDYAGYLESIVLRIKSVQVASWTLYVFTTQPTNTTWTDKTAGAINALDIPYLLGAFAIPAGLSGLGTHTVASLLNIHSYMSTAGTDLWAVLTVTGTPTFTATSDVSVELGVRRA